VGSTVHDDLALVAFRGDIVVWVALMGCVLLHVVVVEPTIDVVRGVVLAPVM
jgi:hypothetical protein